VAEEVIPMAVCDDAPTFESRIAEIMKEARTLDDRLGEPARMRVDDRAKGPAYAVTTEAQRRTIVQVARRSGLILDPVYTGKAMAGLFQLAEEGALAGKRVLFLHTGGLPGLLAQGDTFTAEISAGAFEFARYDAGISCGRTKVTRPAPPSAGPRSALHVLS
jgi:D-cysteine desulfhydrase